VPSLNTFRLSVRWLAFFVVLAATLGAAGGRHLIKKIPVPGDYGWDYLTADTEGSTICGGLDAVELRVLAVLGHQFLVRADLHEPGSV
jgi:hypothetical protein